jgi:hypothetical protein
MDDQQKLVRAGEVACKLRNISYDKLFVKTKKREIVECRQLAMYFAKKYTQLTLREVGDFFADRDHSTVCHAQKTIKTLSFNKNFKSKVDRLENEFLWYCSDTNPLFYVDGTIVFIEQKKQNLKNAGFIVLHNGLGNYAIHPGVQPVSYSLKGHKDSLKIYRGDNVCDDQSKEMFDMVMDIMLIEIKIKNKW